MVIHSPYLNPFQPFPERELTCARDGDMAAAIENNLSRAVFSALANSEDGRATAVFLRELGRIGSATVQGRVNACCATLSNANNERIAFGLQKWPTFAITELPKVRNVLLVGISSSHTRDWTHNQRCAPTAPIADAWIYIPGEMLVVFECKNDDHPQDATQMSVYAHALGLLKGGEGLPCPAPGQTLSCKTDARRIQDACRDVVLDVPWSSAADALRSVEIELPSGSLGACLSGQAAAYIRSHLLPVYCGTGTVIDWLGGGDLPDRRLHLRRLIKQLSHALIGPIHFIADEEGPLMQHGAGSAVFVKLARNGTPVQVEWLGRKVAAVLWFRFAADESQRIGLEFYVQSKGSHSSARGDLVKAWNKAREEHLGACVANFTKLFEQWVDESPRDSKVIISVLRFRGRKQSWQGGGEDASDEYSPALAPRESLKFLHENRSKVWFFPEVYKEDDIPGAAKLVRKPALSLIMPFNMEGFRACGNDPQKLQHFFGALAPAEGS